MSDQTTAVRDFGEALAYLSDPHAYEAKYGPFESKSLQTGDRLPNGFICVEARPGHNEIRHEPSGALFISSTASGVLDKVAKRTIDQTSRKSGRVL